jgi:WD40 repeat protein
MHFLSLAGGEESVEAVHLICFCPLHVLCSTYATPPLWYSSSLAGGEESVEAVGWSRHLPLAASAGGDGLLRVWDVGTAGERAKCEHPDVSVTRRVSV